MFIETGVATMKPPASYRGHHCTDCGVPISPYSRGRCRKCGYVGLKRAVPDDFHAVLRLRGSQGAAEHYHASLATVTRWRREVGFRPQERARKPSMMGITRSRGFVERPLMLCRDFTLAGQAADFLRKWGAVYRCDEVGKPNAKGSHWKRNFTVLTDDEIRHRATRLGWKAMEF